MAHRPTGAFAGPASAHDAGTLKFYAGDAAAYAARSDSFRPSRHLDRFLAALPSGGQVLELGCGAGRDSMEMLRRGFEVTPTDGSPEMAREAGNRLGRPVQVLLFGDLNAVDAFDGIWANACLLHVPARALGRVISHIHRALHGGGLFYASYRMGADEYRDGLGRHYTCLDERRARLLYDGSAPAAQTGGWSDLHFESNAGGTYDGSTVNWLHVFATKGATDAPVAGAESL